MKTNAFLLWINLCGTKFSLPPTEESASIQDKSPLIFAHYGPGLRAIGSKHNLKTEQKWDEQHPNERNLGVLKLVADGRIGTILGSFNVPFADLCVPLFRIPAIIEHYPKLIPPYKEIFNGCGGEYIEKTFFLVMDGEDFFVISIYSESMGLMVDCDPLAKCTDFLKADRCHRFVILYPTSSYQ